LGLTFPVPREEKKLRVTSDLTKYGIKTYGLADPSFDDELQKYLTENAIKPAAVADWKDSAILVRNNADHEIVGIRILWTVESPMGQRRSRSGQNNPGALIGMKVLDPAIVGHTSLINIGAVHFFSFYGDPQSGNGSGMLGGRPPTVTSAAIDGIFFDDGSFAGANESFYFEEMSGSTKAERDFIEDANKAVRSGMNPSEILNNFIASHPDFQIPAEVMFAGYKDGQQAFDLFYKHQNAMIREQIESIRNAGRSDEFALNYYTNRKPEDFKTLRKLEK
jgi:hypothetical protein